MKIIELNLYLGVSPSSTLIIAYLFAKYLALAGRSYRSLYGILNRFL